jgi:mannosyltransferase OCH1-like enzyme
MNKYIIIIIVLVIIVIAYNFDKSKKNCKDCKDCNNCVTDEKINLIKQSMRIIQHDDICECSKCSNLKQPIKNKEAINNLNSIINNNKKIDIPKKIFLCYKNKKIPPEIKKRWLDLNPDYEVFIYDNNDCIDFLRKYFNEEYVDIFNFLKDGPIKADFWRVCILYIFGGVYCDIDVKPLVPIKDFLEDGVDFLTCSSIAFDDLNPHIIICPPKHKILKDCINIYLEKHRNHDAYGYWQWSIVHIMVKVMKSNIDKKNLIFGFPEGIIFDKYNNKIQLLKEESDSKYLYTNSEIYDTTNTYSKEEKIYLKNIYCKYGNKKILYNRSEVYDPREHKFIE